MLSCKFLAFLLLQHVLQQTERDSRFCCCTRLGDNDDTEFLTLQKVHQFVSIVFADILTGKQHAGTLSRLQGCERVAQRLNHGFCAEVASADTDSNNILAILTESGSSSLNAGNQAFRSSAREMKPAQEVVTCTGSLFQFLKTCGSGSVKSINLVGRYETCNILNV